MNTAAKVAARKEAHPELYCPHKRCLWRTGDGSYCPRHATKEVTVRTRFGNMKKIIHMNPMVADDDENELGLPL